MKLLILVCVLGGAIGSTDFSLDWLTSQEIVKRSLLNNKNRVGSSPASTLRVPIDTEYKRLQYTLSKYKLPTKKEAFEKTVIQIIQTDRPTFPHLRSYLSGYYNLRRNI